MSNHRSECVGRNRDAGIEALEGRVLFHGDVVLQWNDILLDAVRARGTAPPYAARDMAIVHVAVFDAVNAIDGQYHSYRTGRSGPKGASPEAAAAQAAHDTLVALYPTRKAVFDAALTASLADVPDGPAENKGVALGRSTANRVLAGRKHDGADETVQYTPGVGPADWRPTPPGFAPALLPQWPDVEPFAMDGGSQFRPAPPPDITSAAFAEAFDEVKALGAADSPTRTAEQTQIALFWADGAGTATPPGHWNRIAGDVAEAQGNTLAENARLFALLNIALADAGIVSWDAKYFHDFCRPVTAVRAAADDGNPATEADPVWSPLIATPPFPSYTSGHSTFSAAAATVLAGFFGADDLAFKTTSEGLPGVEREFNSFSEAAEEAGLSRIYGGIHWSFDNVAGLRSGEALGRFVLEHYLTPRDEGDAPGGAAPALFSIQTQLRMGGETGRPSPSLLHDVAADDANAVLWR